MKRTLIALAIAVAAVAAIVAPGIAGARDHNGDRISDKWEKQHHLTVHANDARKDPDHDGLSNLSEFRHNTDPQKADTDNDGVDDQNEADEMECEANEQENEAENEAENHDGHHRGPGGGTEDNSGPGSHND